jgi:hypothetical protein
MSLQLVTKTPHFTFKKITSQSELAVRGGWFEMATSLGNSQSVSQSMI